ncbi:MAG: hypothetical protein ACFNLQ_06840 [Capnocytophaga ochracea]
MANRLHKTKPLRQAFFEEVNNTLLNKKHFILLPKNSSIMNTITLQATINEADFPTFLSLFEKFKVKTVLLSKKEGKKTYPIETAIPNEETQKAFQEVKEKGHLMKKYKDVRQLFKDIDDEQL